MRRQGMTTVGLLGLTMLLAGCGGSGGIGGGGAKIDLATVEDNQVALNVEGMV